ncbi:MAG: response regulator receiver [Gemmatimonadetes bacterium]|nr:response regulator receiver [Gemmatimonadota bacterium]
MTLERTAVLLVDDDEDTRVIYSTLFKHAGIDVITARDGAEGLRLATESRPRVILMDIGLPILDGVEAVKRIRATPASPQVTIIALTGLFITNRQQELLESGFDDVILKPASPHAVLDVVQSILRNSGST